MKKQLILAAIALSLTACAPLNPHATVTTVPQNTTVTTAPSNVPDEPSITAPIDVPSPIVEPESIITAPIAEPIITVPDTVPIDTVPAYVPEYVPVPELPIPELLAPVYTFEDAITQCETTFNDYTDEQSDCLNAAIVEWDMYEE